MAASHSIMEENKALKEELKKMRNENEQLNGMVGFYKRLMDEVDAEVPYEERQYICEEDDGQGGTWDDGETHEGLLDYIKKIRKNNKVMEKQLVGLLLGVPSTRKQYDAWKSAMDEAKEV
tara:strand:+ start:74 stop:433 length:360 start_codon:yes stop_codon:yes gene_type:complete